MQRIKAFLVAASALLNIFAGVVFTFEIPELVLHVKGENRSITLRGDQCGGGAIFDSLEVSCACITGLWAFYQRDCERASAVIGASSGQCVDINFTVRKATLMSPLEESSTSSSAVVFDPSTSSIGGKYFSAKEIPSTVYFVPAGFPVVVTTGGQAWRIPHKKICMKPFSLDSSVTSYCLFKHSTFEEHRLVDEDCFDDDSIMSPESCQPYLRDEDVDENVCAEGTKGHPKRTRRETNGKFKRGAGLFLEPVPFKDTNKTEPEITDDDENHGLVVTIERPLMNAEIWNSMTFRAQVRLGIREPKKMNAIDSVAYSPAFEFLEIAKRIQQEACPDHYVTDEHYDIAVGAFESLQKNYLGYMDPYLDFPTSERIIDALNTCLNNTAPYPFVERIGKANVSCNGSVPITHGSFRTFDQTLELSISHDQSSRANEPIVETVWKVFVHAHSACFRYFDVSFNDHHRFATVMLPLFTNGVNDIWFNVTELKPDIYTGFLGDAVDLMDSVAYCAIYSRLESPYPWDLPRPKKDNARKKRQVSERYSDLVCMEDYDARNACPRLDNLPDFLEGPMYS